MLSATLFPQRLENLENENGRTLKKMEKVMDFCNQSWKFTNFAPEFDQICVIFADI